MAGARNEKAVSPELRKAALTFVTLGTALALCFHDTRLSIDCGNGFMVWLPNRKGNYMLWHEIAAKVELKGFEDGLNDVRRRSVDTVAYEVNSEYRKGVDIAQQILASFGNTTRRKAPVKTDEKVAEFG